ncbi:MAG: hypothetical protein ABSB78_14135 [Bacteroidota bacterium]
MKTTKSLNQSEKRINNNEKIDEKWLLTFYTRVAEEIGITRQCQTETHTWVITLTAGIVAAVIAIGNGGVIYPNESSYLLLLAITPLLFRFFVRSCLEYQIMQRWIALRNAIDTYYYYKGKNEILAQEAIIYFNEINKSFYLNWNAAKPMRKMILDNLLLAFAWPMIILVILLILGGITLSSTPIMVATEIIVAIWMTFEIIAFITYRGFKYVNPVASLPKIQ